MITIIHTAIISHEYGINTYYAKSFEGIKKQIFEYVKEHWEELHDVGEMPQDMAEAINTYFDENGEEWWEELDILHLDEIHE